MSLSETQEIFHLLTQIDKLLADIELKISSIEGKAPRLDKALATTRQYFRLLTQINHILSHLGLPEEIDGAIMKLQKAIFFARALTIAMNAMTMGPVGIVLGALTITGSMIAIGGSPLEGY